MTEKILISSWLDKENVERIRSITNEVEVIYCPELLPQPRFPGDHGAEMQDVPLSMESETKWLN